MKLWFYVSFRLDTPAVNDERVFLVVKYVDNARIEHSIFPKIPKVVNLHQWGLPESQQSQGLCIAFHLGADTRSVWSSFLPLYPSR